MTNSSNKVLYIGVTSDILRRANEHRTLKCVGFSSKYRCIKLVYFECCNSIYDAISREKQIKGWLRNRKIDLIEAQNPTWKDLYSDLCWSS